MAIFRAVLVALFLLLVNSRADSEAQLIRNGDFNAPDFRQELRTQTGPGQFALSLFTEDLSWNQCLKIELTRMTVSEQGKKTLNANVLIGADGPRPGFPVKPSTTYQFRCDVKGTVPSVSVGAWLWSTDSTETREGYTTIKTSLGGAPVSAEWTVLRGTFRTGEDTKRAALNVKLWSDSDQVKNFTWENGQYLLVDNVQVQEKAGLEMAEDENLEINGTAIKEALATLLPATEVGGFVNYKTGEAAEVDSAFDLKVQDGNLLLEVSCPSPTPVRAENRVNGSKLWSGDVVEVFFGPVAGNKDRLLSQFVLGAGGGRYRGNGAQELQQYDTWQAESEVADGGWKAKFIIPLVELGFSGQPKPGETIAFNVCRQRQGELTSWAPVRNGFHEVSQYGMLVFGAGKDYAARVLTELGDKPAELSEAWDQFAAGKASIGKLVSMGQALRRGVQQLRFKLEPYLLGTMSPTGDYSLPLEPWPENVILDRRKPIAVQAAINERKSLPLTLTNRTTRTVAYRVLLHQGGNVYGLEKHGLDNDFPAEQVVVREALPMKDDDVIEGDARYDALVRLNQANTITVAAGETTVVWVEFDCRGVEPGKYAGAVRVIPLTGAGGFASGTTKYSGQARDFPVQLTVLPITLPLQPALPAWLMGRGDTEDLFVMQGGLGGRLLMINPWGFKFTFNDDGELVDEQLPELALAIRTRLEWYQKYDFTGGQRFMVAFSAYSVFAKQYLPKNIKELTPEWQLAWKNNLLAIDRLLQSQGIAQDDYVIEVFDEPNGKNIERDLEVCRIAREALPKIRLSITWAAANFGHTPDSIRRFLPYINDHCFWGGHLSNPAYRELAEELRNTPGQHYGIYSCSTSQREDLYRYYRMHAWRALEFDAEVIGLYTFCSAPHGTAGATNWKSKSSGGITYRSGDDSIPTVRSEAFRLGMIDLAYLQVLRELAVGDAPDAVAARAFLKSAPTLVVKEKPHDPAVAEQQRQKAIEWITKLQK